MPPARGIPRHADHPGYSIRDRKSFLNGPTYAKKLVAEAVKARAHIQTQTMVPGWADSWSLEATCPNSLLTIKPQVFVFATGARERPCLARLIPGDRPAGVFTTGQLQNVVHIHKQNVGKRAVIVGAELISWSAAMTLMEAGCKTEALVTEYPRGESYSVFKLGGSLFFRAKILTSTKVVRIIGRSHATGVEVEDVRGVRRVSDCGTVVFTGAWIPDNELLRARGVEIDPAHLGPVVDQAMHTSVRGIFTVDNVNHPVETADVVALVGEFAAKQVLAYLAGVPIAERSVRIHAADPIRWVTPGEYVPGSKLPRDRLVAWVDTFKTLPTVVVHQGGKIIARQRLA